MDLPSRFSVMRECQLYQGRVGLTLLHFRRHSLKAITGNWVSKIDVHVRRRKMRFYASGHIGSLPLSRHFRFHLLLKQYRKWQEKIEKLSPSIQVRAINLLPIVYSGDESPAQARCQQKLQQIPFGGELNLQQNILLFLSRHLMNSSKNKQEKLTRMWHHRAFYRSEEANAARCGRWAIYVRFNDALDLLIITAQVFSDWDV